MPAPHFPLQRPAIRTRAGRLSLSCVLAAALTLSVTGRASAVVPARSPVTVSALGSGWVFRDGYGREVVLRGFNVSGGAKLYENGLLPFRSVADAATSAQAMRDQTGANTIRFLINWERVQPTPTSIDYTYLDQVIAQLREFTGRGFYVLIDYHQDLYSTYLFNSGSWYTGDGAPKWVITAGAYPAESCGICILWGQNMQTNAAVRKAAYDFWRNRTLTTSAGQIGVQDAFIGQATSAMTYLKQQLTAQEFQNILGIDPYNEPFDGGLDGGTGLQWEKNYLLPFYQRFRTAMDTAGWAARPAFVEPLTFWNTVYSEEGGLASVGTLGTRFVFNSHYYDGPRMTIDLSAASDGVYDTAMNRIRDRASTLATAPIVTEFGNKMSGNGSDRTPWMIRGMYQGMDSGVSGANWWANAASSGTVLSSLQWHWDTYSGRHNELMNFNSSKVQTSGDAWNGEDFSVVTATTSGVVSTRLDQRVLDRLYPSAVAGDTLAFTYEDLARSGFAGAGTQQAWLTVPSTMPNVAALTGGRQFGILVWREPAGTPGASTEVHLPQSFATASTAVVSDIATLNGLPASGAVKSDLEIGSSTGHRLVIAPTGTAGTVHYALIVNAGSGSTVTAAQLSAARTELASWLNLRFPTG
jgi:hypothetical protein